MGENDTGKESILEFPQLSYKAFSYPGDDAALSKFKAVPGATKLFTWMMEGGIDEYYFAVNAYFRTRVDTSNYPSLFSIVKDCARILDSPVPEVYLNYSPEYNAFTTGARRTCLVLHTSLVEDYPENELRFIIGHELGHMKAGHVLYHNMGATIFKYWPIMMMLIPPLIKEGVNLLYLPLAYAYFEWVRRSEFTADRAGLLCIQDVEAARGSLWRLSGRLNNKFQDEENIDRVLQQIGDMSEIKSKFQRLMLMMDAIELDHPYPTLRLKALTDYVQEGKYQKIIDGDYIRDPLGEHEMGQRVKCYKCGLVNNSKLLFCPGCGEKAGSSGAQEEGVRCGNCDNYLSATAKFCASCGAKVVSTD